MPFLILAVFLTSSFPAFVLPQKTAPAIKSELPKLDSTRVIVRPFSSKRLQAFSTDPAFDYERESPKSSGFFQRLKQWLLNKVGEVLFSKTLRPAWSILPYLLVAAIVVFTISRIMKTSVNGLFQNTPRNSTLPFEELDEVGPGDNLQRLLDSAIQQKKYRRAVRLLYLQTLRQLSESHLVEWRKDKTNRDYLLDLRETPLAKGFGELTRLFDWIWYGGLSLEAAEFEQVQKKFAEFSTHRAGDR